MPVIPPPGLDHGNTIEKGKIIAPLRRGSLPLDIFPNGVFAGSTGRKLKSGYSGNSVQVRRSAGTPPNTQDFGFKPDGSVDWDSVLTFVGSNDGFLTRVYDPSGSGLFMFETNAAIQPLVVSAGSLVTVDGTRPAADFQGTNSLILDNVSTLFPASPTEGTMVAVFRDRPASKNFAVARFLGSADNWTRFGGAGYSGILLDSRYDNIPASVSSGIYVVEVYRAKNGQNYNVRSNGSVIVDEPLGGRVFEVASGGSDRLLLSPNAAEGGVAKELDGYICEWYLFDKYLDDATVQELEDNINSYWAIY